MSTRRALPAAIWHAVRKDISTAKADITSDAVASSGTAPPAHIMDRAYPGDRVKMPPIDDTADNTETLTLPRKAGCACVDVAKCACTAKVVAPPVEDKEKAVAPEAKALPEDQNAAADDGPGVMLALWTPHEVASKICQPGGEKPEEMHTTLGYYGKVGKDVQPHHLETIKKCVAMSAEGYKPVKAHIGGVGRFNGSKTSAHKDVLIAHVDSPGLHDLRDNLIENVHKCSGISKVADESGDPGVGGPPTGEGNGGAAARAEMVGLHPKRDHGYTPHITLAYMDPKADMPIHKLDRQEFTFTHLVMAVGKERHVFPLGEKAGVSKSIWMPIIKADDDLRLATGIVLQPEIVDAQGDIISADVIRGAAHNFLALYNKKTQLGLQHELMKPEGVELVESWIAPCDMVLNNRPIPAGTWMMTVRVSNDVLWTRIKTGSLGGFSIGGVAKVQRLAL